MDLGGFAWIDRPEGCGSLWRPAAACGTGVMAPSKNRSWMPPKLDGLMTRCFDASSLEAWRHGGWQLGWAGSLDADGNDDEGGDEDADE